MARPTDPQTPTGPASAGFLLIALGRILREEVETAMGPRDLSLRRLSALGHLSREPGLSYSELGRRAGVTAQSMQATLRQLEGMGAVERRTLPGRGRTAELHVTARGAELLDTGRRIIGEVEERLLAEMDGDQRELLAGLLLQALTAALGRRAA